MEPGLFEVSQRPLDLFFRAATFSVLVPPRTWTVFVGLLLRIRFHAPEDATVAGSLIVVTQLIPLLRQ
jgi:hypothetical protein